MNMNDDGLQSYGPLHVQPEKGLGQRPAGSFLFLYRHYSAGGNIHKMSSVLTSGLTCIRMRHVRLEDG